MPVHLALIFRPYSFLEIGDEVADREGRAWRFGGPWDWSPFWLILAGARADFAADADNARR